MGQGVHNYSQPTHFKRQWPIFFTCQCRDIQTDFDIYSNLTFLFLAALDGQKYLYQHGSI